LVRKRSAELRECDQYRLTEMVRVIALLSGESAGGWVAPDRLRGPAQPIVAFIYNWLAELQVTVGREWGECPRPQ